MSRIGKKPVKIPSGVKVEQKDRILKISSSSVNLSLNLHSEITVEYDSGAAEIRVTRPSDSRLHRALHGTMRSLIANMVEGVVRGFQKKLEIYGTGYGVKLQGKELSVNVGMAASVLVPVPDGVTVDIETPNARGNDVPAKFTVNGPDKQAVGQFAAEIRRQKPPEPYLGKGIRYADEVIRRKTGKAFASGAQ